MHSRVYFGKSSRISKLLLSCAYDIMIRQFSDYFLCSLHYSIQHVLEQGSINKPLNFDVALIQVSFIPVHLTFQSKCYISAQSIAGGFAHQCFLLLLLLMYTVVFLFNSYY